MSPKDCFLILIINLGGLPKVRWRRDISARRADKEYQEIDHLFSRSSPLAILKPGLPKVVWGSGTLMVVTHKNYQEAGFFSTKYLPSNPAPLAILKPGLPKVVWGSGTLMVVTHKNYQEAGFFLPSIYPATLYLWQSSNQVCQR